jgi:oligoendopeptidase F
MKKTLYRIASLSLSLFLVIGILNAQERSLNRAEIPDAYKWNLHDIYADWNVWTTDLTQLETLMTELAGLKGTLRTGPAELLHALLLEEKLDMLSYKVYRYPYLMRDEDTRNQEVSVKLQQVQILFSQYATATAWIAPEILTIPWDTMNTWLDSDAAFKPFRFGLENLYRQQAHVLDEEKEKLLSYYSQYQSAPRDIYSELSTSDIDFPIITLATGEELKMTSGNYGKTLRINHNQADRQAAFEAHYTTYKANLHGYAAIYNSVCQRDWANTQARNYSSTLAAALESDNIPIQVYENLVNTVKANTQPLQRYHRLRQKTIGLENYYNFDSEIPLTDFSKTYPYDDVKAWIIESVAPLGKEYRDKLRQALQGGWIDVYENDGKRPGAYSADVYGVHPYMLLNYNETLDNVFTLAHELGHTMHTTLANENQPFATHNYTIFVAEVASTFNERLLLEHLLEKSKDPKERIALLQQAISNIAGTFYLQTLFADFEWQIHQLVEQGQPITADILGGKMRELMNLYYGDAMINHELIDILWARIGHFFRTPYYVYQYATCYASSAQIYANIMEQQSKKAHQTAVENYLNLLKSGGNDYPYEQLKKAGVDLTQPEPILAVVKQFDELVSRLEKEIAKLP